MICHTRSLCLIRRTLHCHLLHSTMYAGGHAVGANSPESVLVGFDGMNAQAATAGDGFRGHTPQELLR